MRPLSYSRVVLKLLGYFLFQLVKVLPRRKNVWLIRSHFGFADNAKFLLYQIREKHPEIQIVWMGKTLEELSLARNLGFKAYHPSKSLKGIFYCLISRVYICTREITDINVYLSGGAYFVNLWHGLGIKKMKWNNPKRYMETWHLKNEEEMKSSFWFKIDAFSELFRKPDCMITSSETQTKDFYIPTFNIGNSDFIKAIYPRNSVTIMSNDERWRLINKYENKSIPFIERISKYKKTYIYMPTYRNDGNDFIQSSGIRWNELNEVMASIEAVFVVKLHPFTKINLDELKSFDNILIFPHDIDVYTVLPYIDCLVTDYSSIYCDFLLSNKEVILFPFDYKNYVNNCVELVDYDRVFPGYRVYCFDDLLNTIKTSRDCHLSDKDYQFILNNYWEYAFNNTDIVEEIKKRINL